MIISMDADWKMMYNSVEIFTKSERKLFTFALFIKQIESFPTKRIKKYNFRPFKRSSYLASNENRFYI